MFLTEYARARGRPELLSQWDAERNAQLTPEKVTVGSDEKVWWRCERGHNWHASVTSRVSQGRGCPFCAGQRVLPGETDLAHRYPEVAARWHPEKNLPAVPSQVMPGTHLKYWWRCERGHTWRAPPSTLIQGSGCPYCSGMKAIPGETDLRTTHPALAGQWHPTKNGKLTPESLSAGSIKQVWWLCERGHDFRAYVFSRAQGTGCPYCTGKKVWPGFNDVGTLFPHLAGEWHPELNKDLTPQKVSKGSHKRVWWQCREGHVWKAAVYARAKKNGTGCPVCAGTVRKRKKAEQTA